MIRHRYDPNRFVLISVNKLDEAWQNTESALYVGAGGQGADMPGQYAIARQEVSTWTPPLVSLAGVDKSGVSFATASGRYLFAVARDLGRQSLTVEVAPEQSEMVREKFGI